MNKSLAQHVDFFASNEYRVATIYAVLAAIETNPSFKKTLEEFVKSEQQDFEFWKKQSKRESYSLAWYEPTMYRLVRKVFGLTFTIKLLEHHERFMIEQYKAFNKTVTDPKLKEELNELIQGEIEDEKKLIEAIDEERVAFMSSIVLGLNDGLIELTGALTGFTFALQGPKIIALAGLITGISASLSMASSSYSQARYEKGKDPKKAAFYTGSTYFIVVLMLVAPYLFPINPILAMTIMLATGVGIVAGVSWYSSVLYERSFPKQFFEMLATSLGVAAISFVIGLLMRRMFNVAV